MGYFKRVSMAALALVLAGAGLAACGDDSADAGGDGGGGGGGEATEEPFRVTMLLATAGVTSTAPAAYIQGLRAAAEVLNEDGGIGGRPVEVEVLNTESDATKAVGLLQRRLSSGPKPDLVWAGSGSTEAIALAPILTEQRVLGMGTAGSTVLDDPEAYPYYFTVAPKPTAWGITAAEDIVADGHERIAMISSNDASAEVISAVFKDAVPEAGGELVGAETYAPTDIDMRAQLERLRAQDPEALFLVGFGSGGGIVLEGVQAIGWDIPIYGEVSVAGSGVQSQVDPAALENLKLQAYAVQLIGDEPPSEELETMLAALEEQGKIELGLNLYSFGYDVLMLVAQAAEKAGATDADSLREALETGTYDGVTYDYSYSAESHFPEVDDAFPFVPATSTMVDGRFEL